MSSDQPNPATQTSQGRDEKGRFTTGNTGGPGNPFGRRLAAMRKAVMNAISPDDIEALLKKLLEMAMGGDLAAAKLVLQYAVGKPKPVVEPDRVEVEAWEIEKESWVPAGDFHDVLDGMHVRCASASSDALTDVRCRQISEMMLNPELAEEKPFTEDEKKRMDREWEEINARFEARRAAGEYADIESKLFPAEPSSHHAERDEYTGRRAIRDADIDLENFSAGPSSAGRNGQNGNGKHHIARKWPPPSVNHRSKRSSATVVT